MSDTRKSPCAVEVEAGKSYWWCACGRSKAGAFCDGSHQGTGIAPVEYKAEKSGTAYFCGCGHTRAGVLCDGSHKEI